MRNRDIKRIAKNGVGYRHRIGKKPKFEDPNSLWEAACAYFDDADSRQWTEVLFVGKYGEERNVVHCIPYTLQGLCTWMGVNEKFFNDIESCDYYRRNEAAYSEIVARIRGIIRTQQLEGAMNGFFNPNLVARVNGYRDGADITSAGASLNPTIIVRSKEDEEILNELGDII